MPSTSTLRPSVEKSKNGDKTQNLYIEGDNFEVLKQLQKTYHNKIKMIYIDPPYNTGHDFVYVDNFNDSIENYLAQTNQINKTNPETSGRFHTEWLNMIYPRLILARSLLSNEGSIFISIDDNEYANLKKICDELFGESNFVGNIVWEGNGKNDSRFISESHEYVLVYAKDMQFLKNNGVYWRVRKSGINEIEEIASKFAKDCNYNYKKATGLLRDWYKQLDKNDPSWKHKHYNNIDENGVYFAGDISAESGRGREPYTILHPLTKKPCKLPARGFPTKQTMDEWISKGYVDFGEDENCVPKRKRYLKETDKYVLSSVIYKDSRSAFKDLVKMFGSEVFDNPKDVSIIQMFIEMCTNKDDIIVDFFSGSATTAQAVIQANAVDNGNRKFIMIQLPEKCDEKSDAFKAGYKTICDIGEDRIRISGEKIKKEWEEKNNGNGLFAEDKEYLLDIGFRVFKLDSSNIEAWDNERELTEEGLFKYSNEVFKEGRSKEDVLYEIMLKYGIFDREVTEIDINGKTMYQVGRRYMIICLEDDLDVEDIVAIGEKKPNIVVFKESGFKDDNAKINAVYNLKKQGVEEIKCI